MRAKKDIRNKPQKSFAKAFKMDIGREKEITDEKWEVQADKSLLMNLTRQIIFKYLCEYPCASLSTIARDIQLSPPSTSWHLKLLSERKLVSEKKLGGTKIFYPNKMLDKIGISVLSLLANQKMQDIFLQINNSPGISQKELTERLGLSHQSINAFTNRLRNEDLITIVRDGKFTRYYPTTKLDKVGTAHHKKLKEFKKWVIKAFKFDGVNPKLLRVTDRHLLLQITAGKKIKSIKLSVNPFLTITQNKSRFLSEIKNIGLNE